MEEPEAREESPLKIMRNSRTELPVEDSCINDAESDLYKEDKA